MKPVRVLLAGIVILGVVVLSRAWGGGSAPESATLEAVPIPAAVDVEAAAATWFCTASSAASTHVVELMSPSGSDGTAEVTAYGADGALPPASVAVTGAAPALIDTAQSFGSAEVSVMVESTIADLVVEHRVVVPGGESQVPCATSGSDEWFFPSQSTVRGASAQLVLFNPFPKDASLDVVATVDNEVIAPPGLTGIVVPAGTRRVVDIGEFVQRRPQLSLAVRTRTGRVVAETVQWLDISDDDAPPRRGLRLQLGVPGARSEWFFAGGFTGEGAQEYLVAHNPGEEPVSALVQVLPYGAGDLVPEPLELQVAPGRTTVLDLSAESRVPPVGLHAITVTAADGGALVVGRVNDITGATEQRSTAEMVQRPPLERGTTIGTGAPGAARRWATSGVPATAEWSGTVLVHNPAAGIAIVTARVVGGELTDTVLADSVEVAPGDTLAIGTGGNLPESGSLSVVVESDEPVVVEPLLPFAVQNDFSMGMAVPLLSGTERLVVPGR